MRVSSPSSSVVRRFALPSPILPRERRHHCLELMTELSHQQRLLPHVPPQLKLQSFHTLFLLEMLSAPSLCQTTRAHGPSSTRLLILERPSTASFSWSRTCWSTLELSLVTTSPPSAFLLRHQHQLQSVLTTSAHSFLNSVPQSPLALPTVPSLCLPFSQYTRRWLRARSSAG